MRHKLESPPSPAESMESSHITALLPLTQSPHFLMLSKPRVGADDLFKVSGPDGRLKCVRGERDERGGGGSHIFSRLFRTLHSRGRPPVRELYSRSLVCRRRETIEPRYQ